MKPLTSLTPVEKDRLLAEWLSGKSLDGFGIYSASGQRLRERDFDSREEAQRYIDSEDERQTEQHKAAAHGVNIQPCVKAHRSFVEPEMTVMLLSRIIAERYDLLFSWQRESECVGDVPYIDFLGKHILYLKKDLSDLPEKVRDAALLAFGLVEA